MGRRKIEIQPITRKNGLFKKAYELGVLCSVDVAVIVFASIADPEINYFGQKRNDLVIMLSSFNIVQRTYRHDGERDSRGPVDFAPGAATKVEDTDGDIGDDDEGEDEQEGNRGSSKRRGDGLQLDPEYMPPRSLGSSHSFPPNPAASMIQKQQSLSHRSGQHTQQRHYEQDHRQLHLTTDRHQLHSSQTKRPRLGIESPSSIMPYSNSQFRIPGHPSSLSQSSSHGHGSPIQSHSQSSYQDYPQFSAPHSTSQNFASLQMPSPRDRDSSAGDRVTTPRTIYGNMGPTSSTRGDGRGPDSFAFLEDGRRRSATGSTASSGLGLDWPSSKGPLPPPPERDRKVDLERSATERTTSGSSGSAANPGTNTTGGGGPDQWLDFLSGNGNATASSGAISTTSPQDGVSWERGASNRGRTGGVGGPGNGAGGIDEMALFGLNSSDTKKEGG
ncbi:hypothetical protein DXG01_005602 [Tephrocybe rancida]|nr:hypothetical protein DXG01_005602 [Tephrocybe rancida]